MTETARVLLTAVILTAVALGVFAARLARTAPGPSRLVGQLHLSQWAALVLVVQGALSVGLAVAAEGAPHAAFELTAGLVPMAAAAFILRCEPQLALHLAAAALGLHAAVAFGHRPGWWNSALAPEWFWLGQALYDLYVATLCSLCARAR